jgi:hypothetical protein
MMRIPPLFFGIIGRKLERIFGRLALPFITREQERFLGKYLTRSERFR